MTGHRKFTWQTGIPPAAEWFDFDREENTMLFDPETQPPLDELDPFDDDYLYEEPELACPNCGEENYYYVAEVYDDEEHIGSSYHCEECGHEFTADD